MLKRVIFSGWPSERDALPDQLTSYYSCRDELAVQDGLIFKDLLCDTISAAVIHKLKAHFVRYGSPTQVVSDNGPQYTSVEFHRFAREWVSERLCSSPGNSRANGKAESAVKTAKRILTKSNKSQADPYLALLDHRNTSSQGLSTSPAQRLMNRSTRMLLPTTGSLLEPRVVRERERMKQRVQRQADNYNKSAKDLAPLDGGDIVRMQPLVQVLRKAFSMPAPQDSAEKNLNT
ncbi:uncharacterized protein [Mobula birostris]|uniref:uncharacterized protein n=1 Tax=Mobula birostris TaxID=1983395 RepID=UPI003B2869C3